MRANAPIWTPPVVQEEMKEWATGVGLHVSIRLVSPLADSSPDGNPPANSPYAQRSRSGPEALSGWVCDWGGAFVPLAPALPGFGRPAILLPARQ